MDTWLQLTFPKKIISCIGPKILTTDSTVGHKEYLNDVALRTVPHSCRLSTADTILLFMESVNTTNITVYILQCVTDMNLDILQNYPKVPIQHHFHTQDWTLQTIWSELNVAPYKPEGL